MSFFDFNRDGIIDLADHFLAYNTFFADETDTELSETATEYGIDPDEYEMDEYDW